MLGHSGLSKLSRWWLTLGIRHQRIELERPEQNGRHERMPRTLKAEATRPPEPHQSAQQARFARPCRDYIEERPPEALHDRTPASLYRPSIRPLPARLTAPAYSGPLLGASRQQRRNLSLPDTPALHERYPATEDIALEETADGIWSISCYDVLLARLNAHDVRLSA